MILASVPFGLLIRKQLQQFEHSLLILDAMALAMLTIVGLHKTLALGLAPWAAVIMGILSGIGGGMIRDILSGTTPLVLKQNIYAASALAGGLVYIAGDFMSVPQAALAMVSGGTVFILRLMDIKWDLSLPKYQLKR